MCGESTGRLPCWFLLDAVLAANHLKPSRDIDEAITYAVKRGWLETAGQPVHSLTITSEGITALEGHRR